MLWRISDHPHVPLIGLWLTNCEVKWVWNHRSPIDWCAKEVGGHPFSAAWGFVASRLLGWLGCRYRSCGIWLGLYAINVLGVWVECMKALLVNVCNGTAKSAEIGSRDMWVSTGQHADCAGGRIPLYIPYILLSTRPSQRWLDQVTIWVLSDNNTDGAEGIIPYIWIFVDF